MKDVYGQIHTTDVVAKEFGKALPDWIQLKTSEDRLLQNVLEATLDEGEASAIALALEVGHCILILDDLAARKFALQLGIELTGTLGILVKARKTGIIPALRPVLNLLKQHNFRISDKILSEILKQAGEYID